MADVLVVDSSPLIVLARAGLLALLTDISDEVGVPEAVASEILAGPEGDAARTAVEGGWGVRKTAPAIPTAIVAAGLGAGETAVIALALSAPDCTAVLHDSMARNAARAAGVSLMGTLGVIARARQASRLVSATDAIARVRAAGPYVDESLVDAVLRGLGER